MAYDKVIDSAQLDSGMKASADAIREKTGDTATVDWLPNKGFADAIAAIQTGGGGGVELPERRLLCTLTAEMTWKEIIEANPIALRYEKSLIWLLQTGDNVATQGSNTYKWIFIYHDSTLDPTKDVNQFMCYSYVNSKAAPNSMNTLDTAGGVTNSYITVSNGVITSINRATHYVAAGNSIYMQEIPFDLLNCKIDTTEWGVS